MPDSVAEIRLKCLSLAYRLDQSPEDNTKRADELCKWVMQDSGQSETTPRRGRTPKSESAQP